MATIDYLFTKMLDTGASDLHITSGIQPLWRLHGDIVPIMGEEIYTEDRIKKLLYEIVPDDNKDQFENTGDTDFAYELDNVGRFRANYFRDNNGIGAVFRIIPSKILTAKKLGLPDAILKMCKLSKGLVVVTGPTGSGKSTTLAAMIDYINKTRSEHIITIEDPIEFVHKNQQCLINQREVGVHTKSFKSALKAALREDPDIVLVGEMRDIETVEIAIETAETGHLVFGTLHTNTAASTVERIIQQFPGERQNQIRQMLSNSLKGVVAQTLLKKIDGSGRVAALEIMVVNNAISSQIREGKTHQITSSMQVGAQDGMVLLNDSLLKLAEQMVISGESALVKAVDKKDMEMKLTSSGIPIASAESSSEQSNEEAPIDSLAVRRAARRERRKFDF